MILPPSSNFDQRLDRLEARLGSVMHEMREFIASMNSRLNQWIEEKVREDNEVESQSRQQIKLETGAWDEATKEYQELVMNIDAIYEDQESSKQVKRSKTRWIAKYKKQHKDFATKSVKKKYCMTKKLYSSSIVGATMEVTQRKQTKKPEGREDAREALRSLRE
ncbi:hypothetical protein FH972_006190 [Carpinus fangiana]|uniref:Uncharacterized protein n=1 Tax=Carpinus fangiana TaxID=176857 RepID=A0A5N6QRV5_9ROSI|nr:hypothetical protein FH972_006190 [Carpinus fangiana]